MEEDGHFVFCLMFENPKKNVAWRWEIYLDIRMLFEKRHQERKWMLFITPFHIVSIPIPIVQ